jgi:hypothetical protein
MINVTAVAAKDAATIATPCGPIYAGTPEAAHFVRLRDLVEKLQALVQGIQGMTMAKPQVLEAIATLQGLAGDGEKYLREDLRDLQATLETGGGFTSIVDSLKHGHLSRLAFGLSCTAGQAPKPPSVLTIRPDDPRHPSHPENPSNLHKSYHQRRAYQ